MAGTEDVGDGAGDKERGARSEIIDRAGPEVERTGEGERRGDVGKTDGYDSGGEGAEEVYGAWLEDC